MATPEFFPDWAEKDRVYENLPNKVRPDSDKRDYGYNRDEEISAQEFNYELNLINKWLKDFDDRLRNQSLSLQDVYPIGSVYINATSTADPSTIFNFGTWDKFSEGKVLLGESSKYPIGNYGGEETHTLTEDELASHQHYVVNSGVLGDREDRELTVWHWGDRGERKDIQDDNATLSAGGNQPHNNMQPYISVSIWKRIA